MTISLRWLAPCLLLLQAGCQTVEVREPSTRPQAANEAAALNTKLGIGYLRENKLELAWSRLHRALEHDPNFSTAHNATGLLFERLGNPDKAEEHYKLAVAADPSDSSAQNNYGRFLCSEGRYEEGENRLLQATKNALYEAPELVYTNAGLCARGAGELDRAEAYFRTALKTQPKIPQALLSMAEISLERGNYLSARAYLQRYLELAEHDPRSLWLGIRIERELGDRNAESSYAMLLKVNHPDSNETRLLLESAE
jgi:type IV pilus assembly protein PilF